MYENQEISSVCCSTPALSFVFLSLAWPRTSITIDGTTTTSGVATNYISGTTSGSIKYKFTGNGTTPASTTVNNQSAESDIDFTQKGKVSYDSSGSMDDSGYFEYSGTVNGENIDITLVYDYTM